MLVFGGGVSYVFDWGSVGIIIRCSFHCTLSGMGFKTQDLCDILPLYIFCTYTLQFQRYPSSSANPPNQLQLPNPNPFNKASSWWLPYYSSSWIISPGIAEEKIPFKKMFEVSPPQSIPLWRPDGSQTSFKMEFTKAETP